MSAAGEAQDPQARLAKPRPAGRVSARTGEPTRDISHDARCQRGSRRARCRAIARARRWTARTTDRAKEGA
jgi:hypothetical protein